jgi:hypothetical protein
MIHFISQLVMASLHANNQHLLILDMFPNSDPKIMKDVQRALKLKARRDARQSGQLPRKETTSKSDVASRSSVSTTPSPHRLLFPTSPPDTVSPAEVDPKAETEIDFGPSTGFAIATTSLHPVPTSLDNGAVLDWTGTSGNEEKFERRWTLSISRRKEKDRPQDLGPMGMEKQELLHASAVASFVLLPFIDT